MACANHGEFISRLDGGDGSRRSRGFIAGFFLRDFRRRWRSWQGLFEGHMGVLTIEGGLSAIGKVEDVHGGVEFTADDGEAAAEDLLIADLFQLSAF